MSIRANKTKRLSGVLGWVSPLPKWENLGVAEPRLIQTYVLVNVSNKPVQLSSVKLVSGKDERIQITGGSAVAGSQLAPKETKTIHVEINPTSVGMIKQSLKVELSGHSGSLEAIISFFVTTRLKREDKGTKRASYLSEETDEMELARRALEQEGHRRFSRVHARERNLVDQDAGLEAGAQQAMAQNPWLNSQRFDGVDSPLSPDPAVNPEAKREFDNAQREQEKEKQLRLGNMPKFSSAPRPKGT